MARKRDSRSSSKSSSPKPKRPSSPSEDSFVVMNNHLASMGLALREIPGDGNCLFRALGDQLEGHTRSHLKIRQDVVQYMRENREDFEPFVEDDVPFEKHLSCLSEFGTYAGNDAIVAFARLHNVTVVIHQLNAPLWRIHGLSPEDSTEVHVAYHNGDHYNSVRRIGDSSKSPANIKLSAISTPVATKYPSSSPKNSIESEDEEDEDEEDEGDESIESTGEACETPLVTTGIWSSEGTGTRIFGEEVACYNQEGRHSPRLSGRKRKDLKKLERKRQCEYKKRSRVHEGIEGSSETEANTIIVKDLECLTI